MTLTAPPPPVFKPPTKRPWNPETIKAWAMVLGALGAVLAPLAALGTGAVRVTPNNDALIRRIDEMEQRLLDRDERIRKLQDLQGKTESRVFLAESRLRVLKNYVESFHDKPVPPVN